MLLFIAEGTYEKVITIGVQDNGSGIPDEEKAKIFDRFYRAASMPCAAKDEKGHHGLGLVVAKEIISAHRGVLTVTDAEDGGAVFLATLPLSFPHNYEAKATV